MHNIFPIAIRNKPVNFYFSRIDLQSQNIISEIIGFASVAEHKEKRVHIFCSNYSLALHVNWNAFQIDGVIFVVRCCYCQIELLLQLSDAMEYLHTYNS